jgi:hypothetical protein
MKLFNLFKNSYKVKIEDKIEELETERIEKTFELDTIRFTNTTERVKVILCVKEIQHDINLLKSLL